MRRILQIGFVAALTVLFLYLFFKNSDFSRVKEIMKEASLGWLLLGVMANIGALVFRSLRWRTLLSPSDPPPFYTAFFCTVIGFMLSNLLPVRAADVARPALLARRTNIKFSYALGTVLTERVLDLLAVLTLYIIFAVVSGPDFARDPRTAGKSELIRTTGGMAALLMAAMIVFVVSVYFFSGGVRRLHERLSRILPRKLRPGWMTFFDSFAGSLRLVHDGVALTKIVVFTAVIWLLLSSQFWVAVQAVHQPLPFTASFFVTGLTILGLMVPTPGGVGGFHKVCQIALTNFYLFDVNTSVAVAILFHFVGFLPVIALGLILFVKEGLSWRQVAAIEEQKMNEAISETDEPLTPNP